MNSQDFIMKLITARFAGDTSPVLIDDRQYANTGTLRTLHPTTMKQIAATRYSFNDGYCTFDPDVASLWYDRELTGREVEWVCGSIPELVDRVAKYLEGK